MADLDANKSTAVAFLDCFSREDWDGLRDLCDPKFRWVFPTVTNFQSKTLAGLPHPLAAGSLSLDQTIEAFRLTHDGSVDRAFTTEITLMTAEGDRVAAEGWSRAVNKANGRSYENIYMLHFAFREGKIIQFKEFQDTLHLFDVWVLP